MHNKPHVLFCSISSRKMNKTFMSFMVGTKRLCRRITQYSREKVYAENTCAKKTPIQQKQKPRKVLLFNKADWPTLKAKLKHFQQSFLANHLSKTVDELWTDFTNTLDKLSEECIPSKLIRGKSSLPWITQEMKRLIRKRDRLYTRFKNSRDHDIRTKFQTLRQEIKKKIKDSYQAYLQNLLGLTDDDNTCDSKKLFSFLRNSRRDQQGTPPLKHDGILHSETKTKANLFNQQFKSVFTPKEPLSLSRLVCSQVRLFADDTALYLTIESEDDGSALQNDLDILSKWETRWDMEFNPSKCQVVHATGSKIPIKKDYVLHGQVLESVSCAKYLGVDISSSLTWNSHINRIVSSANRTLNFVRRNIKTKIPKVRETAYNSLVRPQLEYASAVWDPNHKKRISQAKSCSLDSWQV